MPALPTKSDLNGTPTTGVFKAAIGAVHDYLAGLFGADGTRATAFNTLKLLDPKANYNLSLVPTVAASALTMTLKSRDASDLAADNPGFVGQRDATLSLGQFNFRAITANVALTLSSGSTLGHADALPGALYWYLIDNAGAQELACSTHFWGESGIVSTTAEGGAGGADDGILMYSASARANVPFRLIGRSLDTQTTAGTWAALPSRIDLAPFDGFKASTSVLGTPQSTASGTSKDFPLAPNPRHLVVTLDQVSIDAADQIIIRLGDSGGLKTTGYSGSAATFQNSTPVAAGIFSVGFGLLGGGAIAASVVSGTVDLYLHDETNNIWVASWSGGFENVAATFNGGGRIALTGPLTDLRVTTAGGATNFDGGSVKVDAEG